MCETHHHDNQKNGSESCYNGICFFNRTIGAYVCFCPLKGLACLFLCYFTETKAAVTDPHTEGIQYIDDKVDGENNNIVRDFDTMSEVDEDSDKEREDDPGALYINRVNPSGRTSRENEKARLRVCVEITHPALRLPVYRMWTGEKCLNSSTESRTNRPYVVSHVCKSVVKPLTLNSRFYSPDVLSSLLESIEEMSSSS